jgi:hypothetical protein
MTGKAMSLKAKIRNIARSMLNTDQSPTFFLEKTLIVAFFKKSVKLKLDFTFNVYCLDSPSYLG